MSMITKGTVKKYKANGLARRRDSNQDRHKIILNVRARVGTPWVLLMGPKGRKIINKT
jgi:hypothetical protein